MASLTDHIEDYLKKLLAISTRNYVEIQRGELARKFACVPSQVNYVLNSRFSPACGYLVESRRGGGGYIRIYRIVNSRSLIWAEIFSRIEKEPFDPVWAKQFLKRIYEEKALSRREAQMVKTLLRDEHYQGISEGARKNLQKELFIASLKAILKSSY